MQVECYIRNFRKSCCTEKCPFRAECIAEYYRVHKVEDEELRITNCSEASKEITNVDW